MNRRQFLQTLAATTLASALPLKAATHPLKLKYLLASALYGDMGLDTILPEFGVTGCAGLDVWCRPHGTQGEQAEAMGIAAFANLLKKYSAKPVCFTQYPLGPFALGKELPVLKQLGGALMVTGAKGPKNVSGAEARAGMIAFLEEMKPHADAAAEHGITIAIENYVDTLLHTPDSIRCWAEIFMHPTPRGVPILPTAAEITATINNSRTHIEKLLAEVNA